ncbi:hypothetical protein ACFL2T_00210, partial [Elusimicrobiota bacterium]
ILSFTGQVQIKMEDGSIVGVVPGAPVPEIPEGAEIVVVSGEAVFEAGGTVVTATKGDSFTFDTSAGAVQIAATGTTSSIQVTVGKTEAVVESGSAVQVTGKGQGKGELKVTEGTAAVTTAGVTTTLTQGQTAPVEAPITVVAAPEPAPTTEEPAGDEPTGDEPAADDADTGDTDLSDAPDTTTPPPPNPTQDACVSPSDPACQ